jgi:MFS family permease
MLWTGAILTAAAVSVLFTQTMVATRLGGIAPSRLLWYGAALSLVALTLTLASSYRIEQAEFFLSWIVAIILFGAGYGLVLPSAQAVVSLEAGSHAQGRAAGLCGCAKGAGAAMGPLAASVFYGLNPQAPYIFGLVFAGCLFLLVLRIHGVKEAAPVLPHVG